MKAADKIYAIDYGTSNSLLTASTPDKILPPLEIDPKASDPTILRSVLFYPDNKKVYFGQEAIDQYAEYSCEGRLFRSIKKYLPNPNFIATSIGHRPYKLEDIISTFLREMKERADKQMQTSVESVVLGRPARFSLEDSEDHLAEERLLKAANQAGFKYVEFFPEPLAAAYEYRSTIQDEKLLLVADLGGGTSDFTVMKISPNNYSPTDVLSLGGLSLAGDAMDGALMTEQIAHEFASEVTYSPALSKNVLQMPPHIKAKLSSAPDIALLTQEDIMQFIKEVKKCSLGDEPKKKVQRLITLAEDNLGFRLFEIIEYCKRELGTKTESLFSFIYPDIDLEIPLQQLIYNESIQNTVEEIMKEMDETLKKAQVGYEDIDIVCATGGTSQIPLIKQALFSRVSEDKIEEFRQFHSVTLGLSRHAQSLLNS